MRPLDSWLPPEDDVAQQFGSLLRHLFALYDVPRFLDAAWLDGLTPDGVRCQEWYKHIGRGRNMRTATGLPIPLTRRMSHHFVQAPSDCPIPAAIRHGQILGLGGDETLARSLLATRIGSRFENNDFWESVIRWFIEQSTLDHAHHGLIVDYLHAEKFVPSVTNPRSRMRGQPRGSILIPPQPNLCMKGRTAAAMIRAVNRWREASRSGPRASFIEWKPTGIPPLVLAIGDHAHRRIYETTELITNEELAAEGIAMHHCVATYSSTCASGRTSIWSMTVENPSGAVMRMLTLAVDNSSRSIVQALGKHNRAATVEELGLLSRWEAIGGPSVDRRLIDRLMMVR